MKVKATKLCKHRSIMDDTLFCYRYSFQHKSKTQHHKELIEVNFIPARLNTAVNIYVFFMLLTYGLDGVLSQFPLADCFKPVPAMQNRASLHTKRKKNKNLFFVFSFILHSIQKNIQVQSFIKHLLWISVSLQKQYCYNQVRTSADYILHSFS